MKIKSLFLGAAMLVFGASCAEAPSPVQEKMKVIFETDMGNDIDDALALDMLYKFMDEGRIELLGIMSNKNNSSSAELIDILGTWYGYPEIPIGIVREGADCEKDGVNADGVNYAQAVCRMTRDGEPLFVRSVADYAALPDAHILYRKLLAEQPDSSVTVISVGFSTNLARLLDTPADGYSPLTGRELVAAKVKTLSVMACNFTSDRFSEYNVDRDVASARKLFAEWPGEIVVSPFELGNEICYPGSSIENDFGWAAAHPVVEAYKVYQPMPYDRPTWDLTSVLYAVEPADFFQKGVCGFIVIDDAGLSAFTPNPQGRHYVLTTTPEQRERIKARFVESIPKKPAKYRVQ